MSPPHFDGKALAGLRSLRVRDTCPEFQDDWVAETLPFRITIRAPFEALLPPVSVYRDQYEKVRNFGFLLCHAAWQCQRKSTATDRLCCYSEAFRDPTEPIEPAQDVYVAARISRMISGDHIMRFEVVTYKEDGVPTVHATGTGRFNIFTTYGDTPLGPRFLPVRTAPEVAPVAPVASEVPRRSSLRSEPSIRRCVSFSEILDTRSYPARESFRFSYINCKERHPKNPLFLKSVLAEIGVEPLDITYESMPIKDCTDFFLFSFSVDNRNDARKIEGRIYENANQFKIENLEFFGSFFYHDFSLRKLLKAIVLCEKYYDEMNCEGGVARMIADRDHLQRAMNNAAVMKEIEEKLTRNGKKEMTLLKKEIGHENVQ